MSKFLRRFFQKATGFSGQSPEALSAESETLMRSQSAGGGIAVGKGEPSPGVPLLFLVLFSREKNLLFLKEK